MFTQEKNMLVYFYKNVYNGYNMRKRIFAFLLVAIFSLPALCAQNANTPNRFINKALYKNIYPSTLNNTRKNDENTDTTSVKINSNMANNTSMKSIGKRGVVKRQTNARTANARRVVPRTNTARSAMNSNNMQRLQQQTIQNNNRGTVLRSTSNRARTTVTQRTVSSNNSSEKISASRCFADYKECMDAYCEREDTAYNRCYCSAKLAQIDATYQNNIDDLIQQIVKLKYNSNANSDEIKEYWDKNVSVYTNDNPWVSLDNALNINWADTESRVRGQNAFNTGHQYCVSHLNACSYMATNLRDAYKSEITRDCATYEKGLQKIQTVAESVIENYHD